VLAHLQPWADSFPAIFRRAQYKGAIPLLMYGQLCEAHHPLYWNALKLLFFSFSDIRLSLAPVII
jgi:hypothetical protein